MHKGNVNYKLSALAKTLQGNLFFDDTTRLLYATDASAYRETPLAVARPKNAEDIKKLIAFARREKVAIIPRAAGTSLAGQVVGNGIVADVTKYMNQILELNVEERWVRVESGVVLDELNQYLQPHELFFAPETSSGNRCTLGGMVGNNACGSHSLVYGSTRDHLLAAKVILSDGSEVEFKDLTLAEFEEKCKGESLENKIYASINEILSNKENQTQIQNEYPSKSLKRRNTGYAIDTLLDSEPFGISNEPFNFCKLLAGSEGTLAFTTELKLKLSPLPPKEQGILAVHFKNLEDSFQANLIALKFKPVAVELMDKKILDCSKQNIEQQKNRFFIQGDPEAILLIELKAETKDEIKKTAKEIETALRLNGYGYHFPLILDEKIQNVWNLRKSALGILSNIEGDAKPVSVIEDTAVDVNVLPAYLKDFSKLLKNNNLDCVYHAHIGSGELHLRPILNLKNEKDLELFRTIAFETAKLVKKYRGSLSGEHGDGRLRGEFISMMVGESNYQILRTIKQTWDSDSIFNPKKIIDTLPITTNLRYVAGQATRDIKTYFDFSKNQGVIRATEKCNGSGDCRKTISGTMCPSFMVTQDEKHSTRARANILREFLTNSKKQNPFDHKEIYEIMDLCLACKACKSECPSSVDMAKLKAEFLQHYYDANWTPPRSFLVAHLSKLLALGALFPTISNFFMLRRSPIAKTILFALGFAQNRQLPRLQRVSLKRWDKEENQKTDKIFSNGKVYLFNDEMTNYCDSDIGIKTILLLNKLGYEVVIPQHVESGRTFISKGLLRKARRLADKNINLLKDKISVDTPLLGVEPSAILSFRDEYPELVSANLREEAKNLAQNVLTIDEFFVREIQKGKIKKSSFKDESQTIRFHGHCQQKAIATTDTLKEMLSFPTNYEVSEIVCGCCGMAGSFGYEAEHYKISMKIGELTLLPEVRQTPKHVFIVASGTSCRTQIKDGTGRKAFHPVEIMYDALK